MSNVLKVNYGRLCAGGRSCWGTQRLNCGYEDPGISSSMQQICCTVQRTTSEVSCVRVPLWFKTLAINHNMCSLSLAGNLCCISVSHISFHLSTDTNNGIKSPQKRHVNRTQSCKSMAIKAFTNINLRPILEGEHPCTCHCGSLLLVL